MFSFEPRPVWDVSCHVIMHRLKFWAAEEDLQVEHEEEVDSHSSQKKPVSNSFYFICSYGRCNGDRCISDSWSIIFSEHCQAFRIHIRVQVQERPAIETHCVSPTLEHRAILHWCRPHRLVIGWALSVHID